MQQKVAQAYRSKLCQRIVLPKSFKDMLRRLAHEDSWERFEELRKAIAAEAEGEELDYLATQEEVYDLALAIKTCDSTQFVDEVGRGSKILAGARVIVDVAATKAHVATAVCCLANSYVNVFMRPFGTCRAPLVDSFCCRMVRHQTTEEFGREMGWSMAQFLDNMLLCLLDALFFKQWVRPSSPCGS